MVPLYDRFVITTRRRCSESEVFPSREIGLDIAIIDVDKSGATGMLGANHRDKRTNAAQIETHTLDD